jgi:hypothetical protein
MSNASNNQGRAYEFVCLNSLFKAISKIRPAKILRNSSYQAAENAWKTLSHGEQTLYTLSAQSTIDTIFALEPNIIEQSSDILNLYIQNDQHGEEADVRDIIIERKDIIWEIGLSIKHKLFSSSDYGDNNRGAFGKVYHTYDLKNKRNICHVVLDSEFEYIEYNGTRYPIRYVHFWDMNVCIATISFEKALFDEKTGLPTSRKSESIDDTIFYFVQDNEIYLPQHKLLGLIKKQVA